MEAFIAQMGRTLLVSAVADSCYEHGSRISDSWRAEAGEDWANTVPDFPRLQAWAGGKLAKLLSELNTDLEASIASIIARDHDASGLAHYIAMESVGSGVAYEDRYDPHGLVIPHTEAMAYMYRQQLVIYFNGEEKTERTA